MGLKVLSLFDGMSCGRVALERAGIPVDNYYASEIDKWAIQISKKNYPDTIHLGDAELWWLWDIPWGEIDVIFAGFPCQAWSLAGNQQGVEDPRGALVHTLLDIWRTCKKHNPKVEHLFENVKMKKAHLEYINSEVFGHEPILINSALVSAQNRQRYYWTSWDVKEQPGDAGILLSDILENSSDIPVIKTHGKLKVKPYKSQCLDANYHKGIANHGQRTCLVLQRGRGKNAGGYRALDGKTPTVSSSSWEYNNLLATSDGLRKFTPVECERLQTLPDNYTKGVSSTQRYKMIGNGWNVDTIVHVLRGLNG